MDIRIRNIVSSFYVFFHRPEILKSVRNEEKLPRTRMVLQRKGGEMDRNSLLEEGIHGRDGQTVNNMWKTSNGISEDRQ